MACLAIAGGAESEFSKQVSRFDSDEFQERAAAVKELMGQAKTSRDDVVAALIQGTKSNSPQVSAGSKETLRKIFSLYELGQGELYLGFRSDWFVVFEDGKIQTYPLITWVDEESPAGKAGLLPGDVVRKCQDRHCGGAAAKNELVRQLAALPRSTTLRLTVGRTKFPTHLRDRAVRSESVELTFKPNSRKRGHNEKFPNERFDKWIAEFDAK